MTGARHRHRVLANRLIAVVAVVAVVTVIVQLAAASEAPAQSESTSAAAPMAVSLDSSAAPPTPDAPSVFDAGKTALTVSWQAPDNPGPPITGYDVQYRAVGDVNWVDGPQDVTETASVIADLQADTAYQVAVRAQRGQANSEWSRHGTGTTAFWEATLTVGALNGRPRGYWGFQWRYNRFGGLDPVSLTYGGIEYEFFILSWYRGFRRDPVGTHTEALDFYTYDHVIPTDWVLRLEGRRFAVSDAFGGFLRGGNPNDRPQYKVYWTQPGLSLDLGAQYEVSLSREPARDGGGDAADELTATLEEVPERHDGATPFNVQLLFSEEVSVNDAAVRDALFEVAGGTIDGVSRAAPPSSVRWDIRVTPDSDADVVLVLPTDRPCGTLGAACTSDDRALSNRLEVTIKGPAKPEISILGPLLVVEGNTAVATLAASDDDTDAEDLVWSIPAGTGGGADSSHFTLSSGGVLAFVEGKDFEAPDDVDTDGTYEVTVRVSDGARSITADLTVSLTGRNEAPTADAGDDQSGIESGAPVTLSGSGSDPDAGDTLTYLWTQSAGPAVTLSAPSSAATTFTAPAGLTEDTELSFRLRVTDADGLHDDDEVDVTVAAATTPLTAEALGVPLSHGGELFSFDLHFSEEPSLSYVTVRDDAFEVTGGSVVKARRRTPGSNQSWTILVQPSGSSEVVLVLAGNRACDTAGAVCTADGDQLSETLTITVPAGSAEPPPVASLTAEALGVPLSHGKELFSFDLHFSEEPSLSYVTVRDDAFEVTGGSVVKARRRTPGSNQSWTILVQPSGSSEVVLVLAGNRACDTAGAVCTADGDQLSETLTITVPRSH